jgi:hypothetical protein
MDLPSSTGGWNVNAKVVVQNNASGDGTVECDLGTGQVTYSDEARAWLPASWTTTLPLQAHYPSSTAVQTASLSCTFTPAQCIDCSAAPIAVTYSYVKMHAVEVTPVPRPTGAA